MRQFYINAIMHARNGTILAKALVCAGQAGCLSESDYNFIVCSAWKVFEVKT